MASSDSEIVIVSVACGSQAEADALSHALVQARLAACVQSHAITSTYRWQGQVETSAEVILTAKTLRSKCEALEELVKANHSYEVPEIIATPVAWVSAGYAAWLRDSLPF